MKFELSAIKVLKFNLLIIFSLLMINMIGHIFIHLFYDGNFNDMQYKLFRLFDFNTEQNIPTLYSTVLLFSACCLLLFIQFANKNLGQSYLPWLALSLIFLFLTIDEMTLLHERLSEPLRAHMRLSGAFYYSWVIPYGIASILIGLAYFKFLRALPTKTMKLFLLSGFIFISGAIGMEIIGGLYDQIHGNFNINYAFIASIEETLEMLGVTIFIYALLAHIAAQLKSPTFKITNLSAPL